MISVEIRSFFLVRIFAKTRTRKNSVFRHISHSVHNSKYNEITTNVYSITLQLYEYPIFLCIYCPWFFDLKYRYHFQYSDFQKTITIVSPAAIGCYFVTIICYGFACMFCIDVTFYFYKLFNNNTLPATSETKAIYTHSLY